MGTHAEQWSQQFDPAAGSGPAGIPGAVRRVTMNDYNDYNDYMEGCRSPEG